MNKKPSVRKGEELVQSPANPETQVDKDKISERDKSAEGFPLSPKNQRQDRKNLSE